MDLKDSIVTCAVNIKWLNSTGDSGRFVKFVKATLQLIRNDLREIFVEITNDKMKPIKLKLKDITIHKKFMAEGKASINFNAEKCILFLSNAPPGPLVGFLRTMCIKLSGTDMKDETEIRKTIKAHLLSGKPSQFEEISPVTNAELILAKKAAGICKSSLTTPSPPNTKKRKFMEERNGNASNSNAAKRLYKPSPLVEEQLKLNDEQMEVLQACLSGKNVFFTGSAGTGKSFLLKKIISAFPPDGTVATASTGIAACLIGGVTLHSFAGIGSGEASQSRCIEIASRSINAQNWRKFKRLIIDEMVDGRYFELPPVVKVNEFAANKATTTTLEKRSYFQSPAWEKCIQIFYELKQVHRQNDPEFVQILNHIRIGHVTESIKSRLLATTNQMKQMES